MTSKPFVCLVIAMTLALAGCAGLRGTGRQEAFAVARTAGTGCDTKFNINVCKVEITVDPNQKCGFAFDPDVLKVSPDAGRSAIFWHLPPGYEFRANPAVGDGIKFVKDSPGDEFDGGGANDDNGNSVAAEAEKRWYHWSFKNSERRKTYRYVVDFHATKGNVPIRCDPAISNLP